MKIKGKDLQAFWSAQALGRAVSRAKRALDPVLPGTPKCKHVVCEKLSEKFQTDCGPISSIETTFTHGIAVSDEIKNLVKQFYE